MELSLSKLPWWGQIGAFVVVCAGATYGFWHFYVSEMSADVTLRQTRLTALRSDIARGVATARRLPEFESQVVQLEQRLENLKQVLPEEKDVADILRRIQGLATQSNLSIQRFTPQPPVQQALYAEIPYRLQAEGTYHDLGLFFDRISKFPRIISVERHLDQGEDAAGAERDDRGRMLWRRRSCSRRPPPGRPRRADEWCPNSRRRGSERRDDVHDDSPLPSGCAAVLARLGRGASRRRRHRSRRPRPRAAERPSPPDRRRNRYPTVDPAYVYEPAGRRDPFVSLLGRGQEARPTTARPPGLSGLLIGEITVKGVLKRSHRVHRDAAGAGQQDLQRPGRATSCSTAP